MARILAIPEDEVAEMLARDAGPVRRPAPRFEELLERHFALVAHHAG